jgi:thiol-disulfide isomerase/thioredoxin
MTPSSSINKALPSLTLICSTLVSVLLAGLVLVAVGPPPAAAQSSGAVQVAGTSLSPGDSATARTLLRSRLGPTSSRWTRLRDSAGRGHATKTFLRIARVAYDGDARADSMLAFFRSAGARHPDPKMQAEFLYGGIQVASSARRDAAQRQFYQRLTDAHEGSHYAKKARRLFSPNSRIQAGKPLPTFALPKLSDSTAAFTKNDFEGQVLLIDFWGSWCGPCIRAMPHLHEAYRNHGGEDFTILSVAMRDTRSAVRKFRTNKWDMPWHHAFVPKGSDLETRLRGQFDVARLPTAILVGPDGTIRRVRRGAGSGEAMARAIEDAVNEQNAGQASESAGDEHERR